MIVFLIMSGKIPVLYLHLCDTHIHHLNYGIFLLSGLGAYLLFWRLGSCGLNVAAAVYGIAMALTFDEFGMWVHLGGYYWQRASLEAIMVLTMVFGFITFAPWFNRFRLHHWIFAIVLVIAAGIFGFIFFQTLEHLGNILGPRLKEIESLAPQ